MLAHSFDQFYVVTTFILPTLDDLKLLPIKYDNDCKYIQDLDYQDDDQIKQNINDLLLYCTKLKPYKHSTKCKSKLIMLLHITH